MSCQNELLCHVAASSWAKNSWICGEERCFFLEWFSKNRLWWAVCVPYGRRMTRCAIKLCETTNPVARSFHFCCELAHFLSREQLRNVNLGSARVSVFLWGSRFLETRARKSAKPVRTSWKSERASARAFTGVLFVRKVKTYSHSAAFLMILARNVDREK